MATGTELQPEGTDAAFEKLRELTRNGYVSLPGDRAGDGSIMLRHPAAPDLVLMRDGSIDVPLGQDAKPPARAPGLGSFWQRTAVVVVVLAASWMLALFLATVVLDFIGRP